MSEAAQPSPPYIEFTREDGKSIGFSLENETAQVITDLILEAQKAVIKVGQVLGPNQQVAVADRLNVLALCIIFAFSPTDISDKVLERLERQGRAVKL